VQNVATTVTDTVANVKETVHESVESVKHAVDIPAHVERHPWLMLGGALATGFVVGRMVFAAQKRSERLDGTRVPSIPQWQRDDGDHRQSETDGGWFKLFEPEIQRLKGLAVGALLGSVREALVAELPPNMSQGVRGIVDAVTEKVGGEPTPAPDAASAEYQRSCRDGAGSM
jgi:hypothetical protein